MNLLLDTHILIWMFLSTQKLSPRVAAALVAPENELWISPITIWEILILTEKRRLALLPDPYTWLNAVFQNFPLSEAPLTIQVAFQSRMLKLVHQDPADRFLAATACTYNLVLITADRFLVDVPGLNTLFNECPRA